MRFQLVTLRYVLVLLECRGTGGPIYTVVPSKRSSMLALTPGNSSVAPIYRTLRKRIGKKEGRETRKNVVDNIGLSTRIIVNSG